MEDPINISTNIIYGAGTDTVSIHMFSSGVDINLLLGHKSTSTISGFILATTHYPEILRKAQDKLSTMGGNGRLPIFKDWLKLPYLTVVIKECLCWHTAGPMGI